MNIRNVLWLLSPKPPVDMQAVVNSVTEEFGPTDGNEFCSPLVTANSDGSSAND